MSLIYFGYSLFFNNQTKWDFMAGDVDFIIIGLDDSPVPSFPPEVQEVICNAKVFSGGTRHKEIVASLLPEDATWITVSVPLEDVFARYESHFAASGCPILVFASGDPLFFGFANTLRKRMPQAHLRIYPAFNSLQVLAHRAVIPYNDMCNVSLTGRPWQELDKALIERNTQIGILTDHKHTPDAIARRMLEYGYNQYTIYIGEHLGNPTRERIRRMSVEETAQSSFERPNCLILKAESPLPSRPFGIPDEAFEHLDGRTRMITKAPIRLLALRALELNRRRVFWDIGSCTGSVSIEARLQFPHLTVVSFEIRPEGRQLMETNSRRFGTPDIQHLTGDFLETDLSSLPLPDAVFIGGHGGKLNEMMTAIKKRLQPGGCIVFNSVSAESGKAFREATAALDMQLQSSVRIALDDYNPIEIMKATL